jgi:hypothetical protein
MLLAGGLATWALWPRASERGQGADTGLGSAAEPSDATRWVPRPRNEPAPGCAPQAERRCLEGDAWWFDGCGQPQEVAEACDLRLCRDGRCVAEPVESCGEVSALGRCVRDTAEICQVGALVRVDCREQGKACAMTGEGPVCRAPSANACRSEPPRCEGEVLRQCRDGEIVRFDCLALAGRCVDAIGARPAHCAYARGTADACGGCECPPAPSDEVCDGRDNDGDGTVDDGVDCGTVPIVAFVVGGATATYGDDDVQAAITEANAWFEREDHLKIVFELREIVRVDEPGWLVLDGDDLDRMLASPVMRIESADFFVPVVLTDEVIVEGVSRPGLSTVPNGMCGGVRRIWERQHPVGLVAVAKRRWPSTLAHELGHFFGLCHTHEAPDPVEQVAAGGDVEDAAACEDTCDGGPDGICDTVVDPGPEQCDVDDACAVHCATADRPDPTNMMAYYPACRVGFSAEQAARMRESLALRRGWHRCVGQSCACDPRLPVLAAGAAEEDARCPEQMTCRPFHSGTAGADGSDADPEGTSWRCDLDGAAVPGGRCSGGGECGGGSICVTLPDGEGKCARTCDDSGELAAPVGGACTCKAITTPQVAVCREDLRVD